MSEMPGSRTTPFAIGSDIWPGLSKLAEECGETVQIIGKIMAFPDGDHPDGAGHLAERLENEMADLNAAIMYVKYSNSQEIDHRRFREKRLRKLDRFFGWHDQERTEV